MDAKHTFGTLFSKNKYYHCIKHCNLAYFLVWKFYVKFPQNFHIKKLGEIMVLTQYIEVQTCLYCVYCFHISYTFSHNHYQFQFFNRQCHHPRHLCYPAPPNSSCHRVLHNHPL